MFRVIWTQRVGWKLGLVLSIMLVVAVPVNGVALDSPEVAMQPASTPESWLATQGEDKLELYYRVAEDLRCPTCTGLSVLQSDAPFSEQIKRRLRELVESGKTEAEIRSFFTERYGLWILRTPPKDGFHLVIWVIPLVFVLLGVWGGVWLRRRDTLLAQSQQYQPARWHPRLAGEVARLASDDESKL